MSETIDITPEQYSEYQRLQRLLEQEAMQKCISDLIELARERGFEIAAVPNIASDGRLVAAWGVQRKEGR